MNEDSSPVERFPSERWIQRPNCSVRCLDLENALLRCLLHVFHIAHEQSRALAGAKFGQRSKSWSRIRIISRRLAGAVKCIAMTFELLTYLWSRALFIGAARHEQTCVCMRSPILHEFRCQYCAQGKGFHIVRAACQYALEKFSKYFIRPLVGEFSYRIWLPPSHPYFRSCVLSLFYSISMLVVDLA